MSKHYLGTPTPTDKLVHYLRLMAESGGVLTKNRIRTVIEAADRLEDLDEQVYQMTTGGEHNEDG